MTARIANGLWQQLAYAVVYAFERANRVVGVDISHGEQVES